MMKILISNQIRRLRFESDEMTQQELARRSGCTRQTINAIEAAKYGPSLELAFKIAEVFGVGIEEVFQYEVVSASNGGWGQATP
ncbi:MAG: helix-turn-helix transcriptional regulator [Gammaproteobacteria bacterium]|nr:helix-turn-helix transcriptional regulator [Gammaproteobacteria bacterium]